MIPVYSFAKENGLGKQAADIRSMTIIKWYKPYKTTVRRGYIIELFRQENLLDIFINKHWPGGSDDGCNKYVLIKNEYEKFINGNKGKSE